MVHQKTFQHGKHWICFELLPTFLGIVPQMGKIYDDTVVYFYWMFAGVQVGIDREREEQ